MEELTVVEIFRLIFYVKILFTHPFFARLAFILHVFEVVDRDPDVSYEVLGFRFSRRHFEFVCEFSVEFFDCDELSDVLFLAVFVEVGYPGL